MTSNIFSILNTAKVGILSQQLAIEVTGHNIANVQTEGFTRQEVNFETARPRQTGLGLLGTGVRVNSITRDFDQFLFNQILGEGSDTGYFKVRSDIYKTIEALFNTTTGRSLSSDLNQFFQALGDLSTNPSISDNLNVFSRGLKRTVEALNRLGLSVVILGNVPEIGWNVPVTLAKAAFYGHAAPSPPTLNQALQRSAVADRVIAELAKTFDLKFVSLAAAV